MSGAERVVDIAVAIRGKSLDEPLLALLDSSLGSLLLLVGGVIGKSARLALLLGVETQVLEKQSLTRLESGGLGLGLHAVRSEFHRYTETL